MLELSLLQKELDALCSRVLVQAPLPVNSINQSMKRRLFCKDFSLPLLVFENNYKEKTSGLTSWKNTSLFLETAWGICMNHFLKLLLLLLTRKYGGKQHVLMKPNENWVIKSESLMENSHLQVVLTYRVEKVIWDQTIKNQLSKYRTSKQSEVPLKVQFTIAAHWIYIYNIAKCV